MKRAVVPIVVMLLGAAGPVRAEDPIQTALLQRIETVRTTDAPRVAGEPIASRTLLPDLYERRGYTPAWRDSRRARDLLAAVDGAERHGLDPEDYHRTALGALQAEALRPGAEPGRAADFDVLMTDALVRLLYHVEFGKADPEGLDSHWNLVHDVNDEDPVSAIDALIASDSIAAEIEEGAPQDPFYRNGLAALARYRAIASAGGWEPQPPGPTLRSGDEGEPVLALRRRLAATGDLPASETGSPVFDAELEAAVKRFQERHFLDADGAVGKGTREALDVPVEARIDQIRVNLDRGRWVLQEQLRDGVLVDIAGFGVQLLRDDEVVWSSRVQIGRPYRRTPVFQDRIRYLEINPTWTVPPGILRNDVLPAIKKDVGYLAPRNMQVVSGDGKRIDPHGIDWSRYPEERFPYRIVQAPGPSNALGRIKFMFPNPHLVFLHDTPSKRLFDRTDRAFSSGCIRVERPFELARLLLDDEEAWSAEQLQRTVDAERTRVVVLEDPVPVFLLYWTVDLEEPGRVGFKRDVYRRDPRVLKALDGEFRFRKRPVAGREQL